MPKSQDIPWMRLTAEGAVVVISILLAFWIDAWWDGHLESKQEQEQLVAMREEFAQSVVALDEVLESVHQHAGNIDDLITLLKDAGAEPVQVPGQQLGYAIGWRTSDVSTSTLDALIASGNLNLMTNTQLRSDLAGLPAFLLNVTEDELLARDFAESNMSSFLAREGLAEAAYANRPGFQRPGAPEFASVIPSEEFVGLLMARRIHFEFAIIGLPSIKAYLEDLVDQIDVELANTN